MKSEHSIPEMTFIVGAPRSGSALLLDFLTVPKKMGWIPGKLMANPGKLPLAARSNKQNWPLLGEFFLERRFAWKSVPEPAGGEAFWSHYLNGFTPPNSDPYLPGVEHVREADKEKAREAVEKICRYQNRHRFVAEYTGLPRIRFLRSVFPDAKFIQVLRDPRSVAYHMIKRAGDADLPLWKEREKWLELMPEELQSRFHGLPPTPLNFCGVLVRWYHDLYKQEMGELPESGRMEVAYSDLLSRPEKTLGKVMNFVDLPVNKRFKYYLKFHVIRESNHRTNRSLEKDEAADLARAVAALDA